MLPLVYADGTMNLVHMSDYLSTFREAKSPVEYGQDTTGTLKTTISLGKNPSILNSGPFYLMKEPPSESELRGNVNLVEYHGLEHTYSKLIRNSHKQSLSSFLPNLPGIIDYPENNDLNTLRSVIEKPPVARNEILPLTTHQLAGFRLHPGPLPEEYHEANDLPIKKHKNKHKKSKHTSREAHSQDTTANESGLSYIHEKNYKKQKRHDEDKDRKKRRKEKKKKKQKHSLGYPWTSITFE